MDQNEIGEQAASRPVNLSEVPLTRPSPASRGGAVLAPQANNGACNCPAGAASEQAGTSANPYVYAIGQIDVRFPSLGLEKEFAQSTGRGQTAGLSDKQALQAVLSDRKNRYLVRQLCWVL